MVKNENKNVNMNENMNTMKSTKERKEKRIEKRRYLRENNLKGGRQVKKDTLLEDELKKVNSMKQELTNLLTKLKCCLENIDDYPERLRGIQGEQEIRRILKVYEGTRKAYHSKEIAQFLAGREELGKELDSISREIFKRVMRYNSSLTEHIVPYIRPFLSDFLSEKEKKAIKERENKLRKLSAEKRMAIYELEIDIKNFEKKKAKIEKKIGELESENSWSWVFTKQDVKLIIENIVTGTKEFAESVIRSIKIDSKSKSSAQEKLKDLVRKVDAWQYLESPKKRGLKKQLPAKLSNLVEEVNKNGDWHLLSAIKGALLKQLKNDVKVLQHSILESKTKVSEKQTCQTKQVARVMFNPAPKVKTYFIVPGEKK